MTNTQHNVVFHGKCPLSARFSTQEVIRVALECPWGDLQAGVGFKARPYTPNKIDIGVARSTQMCKSGGSLVRIFAQSPNNLGRERLKTTQINIIL